MRVHNLLWGILFALLALSLLHGPAALHAEEGPGAGVRRGVITADRVNVRAGPSANYRILKKLQRGDAIRIHGRYCGWYRIKNPPHVGLWMHGRYINRKGGSVGLVTRDRVNVRPCPGYEGGVMGQLDRGDMVRILGTHGGWAKIAIPRGIFLWIHSRFVVLEPGATAPARPAGKSRPGKLHDKAPRNAAPEKTGNPGTTEMPGDAGSSGGNGDAPKAGNTEPTGGPEGERASDAIRKLALARKAFFRELEKPSVAKMDFSSALALFEEAIAASERGALRKAAELGRKKALLARKLREEYMKARTSVEKAIEESEPSARKFERRK
jgi:SH3-like domain-containing protein